MPEELQTGRSGDFDDLAFLQSQFLLLAQEVFSFLVGSGRLVGAKHQFREFPVEPLIAESLKNVGQLLRGIVQRFFNDRDFGKHIPQRFGFTFIQEPRKASPGLGGVGCQTT